MRQFSTARSSGPTEPWIAYYAQNDTSEMVRQLWNLLAAVNTPKGKKAPVFPDPAKSSGKALNTFLPQRPPPPKKK